MAQATDLQVPKPRIAGPRFSIRAPGTHKTAVDIEVDDEDVSEDSNRISELEAEVDQEASANEDADDQSVTPLMSDMAKRRPKRN